MRGSLLPQGLVRNPAGLFMQSDDALGDRLVLVGFGCDPAEHLSPSLREAWARAGGGIVVSQASASAVGKT